MNKIVINCFTALLAGAMVWLFNQQEKELTTIFAIVVGTLVLTIAPLIKPPKERHIVAEVSLVAFFGYIGYELFGTIFPFLGRVNQFFPALFPIAGVIIFVLYVGLAPNFWAIKLTGGQQD